MSNHFLSVSTPTSSEITSVLLFLWKSWPKQVFYQSLFQFSCWLVLFWNWSHDYKTAKWSWSLGSCNGYGMHMYIVLELLCFLNRWKSQCVCVCAHVHFVRWCKFVSVSASPEPVYKPPKNSQWITLYFIYPFQLSNPLWWNLWKSWLSLDITGLKDITLFCWNIRDWTKSEPRQCRGCSWKANTPSFPTPVAVFAVFTAVDLTECIVIQSMLATPSDLSLEVWPIVNCTWLSVTERATSITNSEASKLPWPQVVGIQPSSLQVPLISQHQWRRSSTRSTWPTNCYCTLSPHWWTESSVNSDPPAEGFSQVKVKSRETVLGGWISARLSARISSLHRWALRKVLFLGV